MVDHPEFQLAQAACGLAQSFHDPISESFLAVGQPSCVSFVSWPLVAAFGQCRFKVFLCRCEASLWLSRYYIVGISTKLRLMRERKRNGTYEMTKIDRDITQKAIRVYVECIRRSQADRRIEIKPIWDDEYSLDLEMLLAIRLIRYDGASKWLAELCKDVSSYSKSI
jgi:hypothetical protein